MDYSNHTVEQLRAILKASDERLARAATVTEVNDECLKQEAVAAELLRRRETVDE